MSLLGLFATVALLLSAAGVYGVMTYLVEQRAREIGVRLALGAERRDILRLMMGRGLVLALWGAAIGLLGALGLTRFLHGMPFELDQADPVTHISLTLLLICVALVACWIPARRATKVDPLVALKAE